MSQTPAPLAARELERLAIYINPGEWAVETKRPIATLLGSCVAVCLYDPKIKLAGMNHFLLPRQTGTKFSDEEIMLNGDYAMEILRNAMYVRGASPSRLIAKAFGGGNIVGSIQMAIGERNATFAREWLEREHIPLVASDFGGPWSRKVIFDPATGDVFCRRSAVDLPEVMAMVRAESEYEQSLIKSRVSNPTEKRIELF